MKNLSIPLLCLLFAGPLFSQNLYFPPLAGDEWDTLSPASLGWCEDKIPPLYDFLDQENTKAFLVLKDGKIVLEQYFDDFTQDSLWYWASAGKSLTSLLVGIAQEQGMLDIDDKTADYLGQGWTDCPAAKEELITIRHQLSMTSGLDDAVPDPYCTLDTCLVYKEDAGDRWAYHNGPYTLLDQVIESASGLSLNAFYLQKLRSKIGMNGAFVPLDYNNVLFTTPRSMARYGLLILNKGNWNGNAVMADLDYFDQMVNSSQDLNPSYGFLWWLNGKPGFMVPQSQFVFNGPLAPAAPSDMFAALGKNGQFINVVPSQNLVFIRMGDAPDNSLVPFLLNDQIWQRLNEVIDCTTSDVTEEGEALPGFRLLPNPATGRVRLLWPDGPDDLVAVDVFDRVGQRQSVLFENGILDMGQCPEGTYIVRARGKRGSAAKLLVLAR